GEGGGAEVVAEGSNEPERAAAAASEAVAFLADANDNNKPVDIIRSGITGDNKPLISSGVIEHRAQPPLPALVSAVVAVDGERCEEAKEQDDPHNNTKADVSLANVDDNNNPTPVDVTSGIVDDRRVNSSGVIDHRTPPVP
ncbi:unnamed protein product, partial [Laminaria digitata]